MKVPLRDCYKAYNGKRNVQHGFQEEEYVKQLVLNFKALKYQAILTYIGQVKSMNVPKESKKLEPRSLFPQNENKKKVNHYEVSQQNFMWTLMSLQNHFSEWLKRFLFMLIFFKALF